MKILRASFLLILRSLVLIGIPYGLIYLINQNYPGLLGERYLFSIQMAILFGTLTALSYFFADLTKGFKKMVFDLLALMFGIAYTLLILGVGEAKIFYENTVIEFTYPLLLTLILLGIIINIPTAILGYAAWREEEREKIGNVEIGEGNI